MMSGIVHDNSFRLWKYMLAFGVGGSSIFLGTVYYVRRLAYQEIYEKGPCAEAARDIFYNNKTAKAILGTPITEHHVETWDPLVNYDNDYECMINLPVEGTKMKGHIHLEGKKNLKTGNWSLTALSLKSEDRKTTLYSLIPPQDEEQQL